LYLGTNKNFFHVDESKDNILTMIFKTLQNYDTQERVTSLLHVYFKVIPNKEKTSIRRVTSSITLMRAIAGLYRWRTFASAPIFSLNQIATNFGAYVTYILPYFNAANQIMTCFSSSNYNPPPFSLPDEESSNATYTSLSTTFLQWWDQEKDMDETFLDSKFFGFCHDLYRNHLHLVQDHFGTAREAKDITSWKEAYNKYADAMLVATQEWIDIRRSNDLNKQYTLLLDQLFNKMQWFIKGNLHNQIVGLLPRYPDTPAPLPELTFLTALNDEVKDYMKATAQVYINQLSIILKLNNS